MRKISDTITRLRALHLEQDMHPTSSTSANRLSTLENFGSNPGALQARYYRPADLPDGAPLVVVLHGCTQNAAGYDYHSGWSQLAEETGFALLYPEQQRANNPNLCFNWFLPADTARNRGEVLSIRQMIETMVVSHRLDRQQVFVTGLSAGGAMAAAMLANYPEVFAGGGIIAGLPFGCATTIPEAFDRMRGHGGPSEQELQRLVRKASRNNGPWPRLSIWHGSADRTVASVNADAIAAQWRGAHKLNKAPTHSTSERGRGRQVWADDAGEAKIEVNMVLGMGHGTPIGDGLGNAGPYMLDVGISSTREIARFWGLADADNARWSARARSASSRSPMPKAEKTPPTSHLRAGEEPAKAKPATPAPNDFQGSQARPVKTIIEDALRAAGLMR
ncbi:MULTISPECIES: PHB depolymerase family esterase [unclassified Mesorhizobium]|uniref:extracellular catalytic domain type 1 short-chain-length polyhydroxyalkanoate depolymerase n=1 Tax=unclassified Mesorhizobium TaxID=325217 RepID=UPI000F761ABD|nr:MULTISPECIES: PHB depolymerase family esterase [unclassified Mesorhizobium]AZO54764.1 PHB depolymerase family esterase [Mesorhizobium sp. M8A.F.Ca.ET.057.01.1.1]RWE44314.1 MAG: PHB depolymerase family esterase [Mesorhizobium sp.]TJX66305.1 MAG: PHB depolymerase family esterase [Mesorhizobium sp.]